MTAFFQTSRISGVLMLGVLTLALSACGGGGSSGGGETRAATPVINNPSANTNASTNTGANANTGTTTNPSSNTTNALKAMNVVTDFKGNNELRVVKPTGNLASELQKVLDASNRLRAEKGLKPLVLDQKLSAYAQLRANDLVSLFKHERPNGQAWHLGVIGAAGENLAAGSNNAADTVLQWRNSKDGHYEAIINSAYTKVGLGVVYVPNSEYDYYWVQIFGNDGTKSPYGFTDESKATNATPLTMVVVNGVSLPISVTTQGNWRHTNHEKYQTWVNGYANSRFGAVEFKIADNTNVFYQGLQTAEGAMPQSGTATYKGQAVVVDKGVANLNVQSQFNANFGNKTLTGTLTENGKTLYNLSADIKGSSFASKANASVQTEGAFFGNNAEELGGIFKDTNSDAKGAFGAKK